MLLNTAKEKETQSGFEQLSPGGDIRMERGKIFFLCPRSTRLLCSPLTRAFNLLSFMTVKKYKTLLAP